MNTDERAKAREDYLRRSAENLEARGEITRACVAGTATFAMLDRLEELHREGREIEAQFKQGRAS